MTFSSFLQEHRLSAGLTQKQLAEQVGVSRVMIAQIEAGNSNPSVETLHRICAELSLTPEERSEALRLAGEGRRSGEAA